MSFDNKFTTSLSSLLKVIGDNSVNLTIIPERRGGNNQSFKVVTNKKKYFLKKYFFDDQDKRNRLLTEVSFLEYANQVANNYVPKVFGFDIEEKIGLYEYIDGQSIDKDQAGECDISEPINFFKQLNRQRKFAGQNASEACFSLSDHLHLIGARVSTLTLLSKTQYSNIHIDIFLKKLLQSWNEVCAQICQSAEKNKISLDKPLGLNERCVSPSDFGFHNSIKLLDGNIIFIDFEYAGWDDPAKMVLRFF